MESFAKSLTQYAIVVSPPAPTRLSRLSLHSVWGHIVNEIRWTKFNENEERNKQTAIEIEIEAKK